MAWTSPATWVAGAIPTAAWLNAQIRDNFKAIGDPWTAYTPTWTASTTNPNLGNGAITGGYMQAGQFTNFWAKIVMGSTTTYGTGQWFLSLPVLASTSGFLRASFTGIAFDASASARYTIQTGTNAGALFCAPTTAGGALRAVTAAAPFTWASGDDLYLAGTYEAA